MFDSIRKILRKKVGEIDFDLTLADSPERGHLSTNVAFSLAKERGMSPADAACEIKGYLDKNAKKEIFKVEVAGPGFINIWLRIEVVQNEFEKIVKAKEGWGVPQKKSKKKIIIEYSQPNIAKPMHVGHLRSTIIGDALANIYDFLGYETVRWNYLGDWGTQFGKLIAAYKLWGDKEEVEKSPISGLNSLYVKFHEEAEKDPGLEEKGRSEFKKLEDGDRENRELWKWFKEESVKEFNEMYGILGIKFDTWIGESFYEKELHPLIKELLKDGIAEESDGAIIVPLESRGFPPGLIRKSDGATLYLTRDIANLKYRLKEYKPSRILYVVDNGQTLHFQQLFAIADILGLNSAELAHVKFGLVLSGDMKRLSTREGRQIALLDVINEAIERAKKIVGDKQPDMDDGEKDKIARIVGVGAVKYNDLSQNRQSDITFDWDKMLSLDGNSGPYLQYTYARMMSIVGKANGVPKLDSSALEGGAGVEIVMKLSEFPEVVRRVAETYFPHYIANYLYELSKLANKYYEKEPVLRAEGNLKNLRLNLVAAVAGTLKSGLGLLGIKVAERM